MSEMRVDSPESIETLAAQLRDVHEPVVSTEGPPPTIVIWPLLVFSMVLLSWFVVRFRRRNRWRIELRRALRGPSLSGLSSHDEASRARLIDLVLAVARVSPDASSVPAALFKQPNRLTEDECGEMLSWLEHQARRR